MKKIEQKIVKWIRYKVEEANAKGLVIGLSGGIDSSVVAVLAQKAIGNKNVYGYLLPYHLQKDSKDAGDLARKLKINWDVINIRDIVDTIATYTDLQPTEKNYLIRIGNIKARTRMAILYDMSAKHDALVIGTGNKTEIAIGYFCYDDKTRVSTPQGLKTYKDLKVGDTVFSLNLKTKHLQETKIKNIYKFKYQDYLLRGKNNGIDFCVTPNHKMVLQKAHNSNKLFLYPLDKYIKNHNTLSMPFSTSWDSNLKDTKINDFDINDLMYLYGLFIGDGDCYKGKVKYNLKAYKHNKDNKTGRFEKIQNPLNKIIYYPAYTINFSIPKNNKNKAYYKLIDIFNKYNIKWHKATCGIKMVSSNNRLFNIFLKCGKYAKNKHIPEFLLKYSSENLKYLFQGLMDSDGDKNFNYYTISKKLAWQIVELSFKIGKSASIVELPSRDTYYKGRMVKSKKSYLVMICKNIKSRTITRNKINKEYYNGIVWCPEVENGNLLIERNGKFCFCGNTKYGDGGSDIEPIGDLYKTDVRELAKYLRIPRKIIDKAPSAGLWEGQTDEKEIGITYENLDFILKDFEHGTPIGYLSPLYKKVQKLTENSEHKRNIPPICKIN